MTTSKTRRAMFPLLAGSAMALLLSGCYVHGRAGGPPPRGRRYGYHDRRRRHRDFGNRDRRHRDYGDRDRRRGGHR